MSSHIVALEQIRRMRGGAQSHLMRCSDGGHYVVKFQNNPQGKKILANELICAILAQEIGLPSPLPAIVDVIEGMILRIDELTIQFAKGRARCQPGPCFGSRYEGDPPAHGRTQAGAPADFLPAEHLLRVENIQDFAGMLVFDLWTCNTDGRQVVFTPTKNQTHYRATMIDNGFCFNADAWNFPDSPLRGIYSRTLVYDHVTGIHSFDPWLTRLEREILPSIFEKILKSIPPEWYDFDSDALSGLLAWLDRRRQRVRRLIHDAAMSPRRPFPHWTDPQRV